MKKRISFLISLLMAASTLPVSANQGGTSTAQFLRIGQGARAGGMGGAFTAIADDTYAVYWNPAGLAQITRRSVGLNHLEFVEKITSQFASLVLPVNRLNGSMGAAITYVDLGKIERRDAAGVASAGETKVSASAATLSWGQAVGDRLAVGAGAKIFNQDLAGETGSGVAADLGLLFFMVPNRVALGASILNLGGQIKTGTTKEDIPQVVAGGLAFYAIPRKLTMALDISKERDTDAELHAGAEYVIQERFVLRGGFQETHEANGGLTAGISFLWNPGSGTPRDFFGQQDRSVTRAEGLDVRFDYGYVDMGDLETTHRIGVHLSF